MKLSDARDAYYQHSGKASDVARQLAFAGIAFLWIFKTETPNGPVLPGALYFPAAVLSLGLVLDLAQYLIQTYVWGTFHRRKELEFQRKKTPEDTPFNAPKEKNWPGLTLFISKMVCVIIADLYLAGYAFIR